MEEKSTKSTAQGTHAYGQPSKQVVGTEDAVNVGISRAAKTLPTNLNLT